MSENIENCLEAKIGQSTESTEKKRKFNQKYVLNGKSFLFFLYSTWCYDYLDYLDYFSNRP